MTQPISYSQHSAHTIVFKHILCIPVYMCANMNHLPINIPLSKINTEFVKIVQHSDTVF